MVDAFVISWNEISGSIDESRVKLTRDNYEQLVRELQELYDEDTETDDEDSGWVVVGISHLPKTTLIEWRSERDHHGVTTICWEQ